MDLALAALLNTHRGDLEEIDFVVWEDDNAPPFVVCEHALAVQFAAVAPTCRLARDRLDTALAAGDIPAQLAASQVLLLLCGDLQWCWALRARIAAASPHLVPMNDELQFSALVLSHRRHAKSSAAWAYRRHCLQRLSGSDAAAAAPEGELKLCERAVVMRPRNYYAWTHRLLVLRGGVSANMHAAERARSDAFVKRNPRDHSAWQYRFALLFAPPSAESAAVETELAFVADRLLGDPASAAIYGYARSLLGLLLTCQPHATVSHLRVLCMHYFPIVGSAPTDAPPSHVLPCLAFFFARPLDDTCRRTLIWLLLAASRTSADPALDHALAQLDTRLHCL